MPSLCNLTTRPAFQMESKAFSKSMNKHNVVRFFCLSDLIPLINLFRYLIVFLLGMNPSWLGSYRFNLIKNFYILVYFFRKITSALSKIHFPSFRQRLASLHRRSIAFFFRCLNIIGLKSSLSELFPLDL